MAESEEEEMSEEDESEEENVQQKVTKRDNCKLIFSSIKFVLYASLCMFVCMCT